MKILHVGYSASDGGAARAMKRLHDALQLKGVDSKILVNSNILNNTKARTFNTGYNTLRVKSRNMINRLINFMHCAPSNILNSHALLPSKLVKQINTSDADIVHLHWINGETLSISDIAKIEKPIVWTLHDMWLICGSEHVNDNERWKSGYLKPPSKSKLGVDLDRWTWNRKMKHWNKPLMLVTPSRWLNGLVAESPLTATWPNHTIKNPIDTDFWNNFDCGFEAKWFSDKRVVKFLFGSMSNEAYHKGGDLFWKIFDELKDRDYLRGKIEFFVLGGKTKFVEEFNGFKCTGLGRITTDELLRKVYLDMDAIIIPSRIDNLPNMGVEALSCGLPIIGFEVCGLTDIIEHQNTGYLAKPFEVKDLVDGICFILNCDPIEYKNLCLNSREKALTEFSQGVVAQKFLELYYDALGKT